jgi:hypothetical protein
MLSLEVVGPGDGGIQLRPNGGGASSSAGERLAVALAVRHRLQTVMGSRFTIFVYHNSPVVFRLIRLVSFIRISTLYSASYYRQYT